MFCSDVDDCTADACANNGQCIDGINDFTCDCTGTGYEGETCQTGEVPAQSVSFE